VTNPENLLFLLVVAVSVSAQRSTARHGTARHEARPMKRRVDDGEKEEEDLLSKKRRQEEDEDAKSSGEKKDDSTPGCEEKKGMVRKVVVLIDEATLNPVKTKRGDYELLNCDDHLHLHKKLKKDPADSRPDIAHQMLLALLDSPLNKAGHLQVYIRTSQNVLIEVSPYVRIPRTYKRFSGLMVQLLHKMKIRASDGDKMLMRVVKNPITRHLPPDARIFGTSVRGTLVDVHEFVPALSDDVPVVFLFGGIAHGHLNPDYAEAMISISEYPLSGACALSRLLGAFERKWGII